MYTLIVKELKKYAKDLKCLNFSEVIEHFAYV